MANGPGLVSGFFGSSKASHSIPEHFLKAFLYLVLFHDVGDRNILRPVFFFVDSNIFSHLLTGRLFSSTTNETFTPCSKHFRRFFQKHLVLIAIQAKADSDTVLLCVAFMVFEPTFFSPLETLASAFVGVLAVVVAVVVLGFAIAMFVSPPAEVYCRTFRVGEDNVSIDFIRIGEARGVSRSA